MRAAGFPLILMAIALAGCATQATEPALRSNDIQAVGTHNSYKLAIGDAEMAALEAANPVAARTLDYAHPPLEAQLDAGARVVELDLAIDHEGGRYAHPRARALLAAEHARLEPFDNSALLGPGFKVLHVQDLDYRSSCPTFRLCLQQLAQWSAAHPTHAPILVMLNLKYGPSPAPGGVEAPAFDEAAFDAMDAEIRAEIPAAALITPDRVQGDYPTLREAIAANNWPALAAARGGFMFVIDAAYEFGEIYRGSRANLEGRVAWPNQPETSDIAGYMTLNDPVREGARIRAAVSANLIVRTRADADTWEARRNDVARREAAFASGAHYVSTDYMTPRSEWSDYSVSLPEGAARCNPVRAPQCQEGPLD